MYVLTIVVRYHLNLVNAGFDTYGSVESTPDVTFSSIRTVSSSPIERSIALLTEFPNAPYKHPSQ